MSDRRCPHDGGACHHECGEGECFREKHGMSLTTPHEGYPKPGHAPPAQCPALWDDKLQCQKPAGHEGPHLYRSESYGHIWGAQFITNDGQVWNLLEPEEKDETDV
jgi:hypothetical protein